MVNKTISADVNPNLVNNIAQAAFAEPVEEIAKAEITAPFNGIVDLPGGYIKPTGEVIKTAEVRELTGRDEEMLGRVANYSRLFPTILTRAVVNIGNEPSSEAALDAMLVGDRDALLLGIYQATFGPTAEFSAACQGCGEVKNVSVDVAADIKSKVLIDPADRTFTVKGKKDEFLVTLPTGVTQKAMIAAEDKNGAEITSVLLENTVLQINGAPVVSPVQIKNLGLVDRRAIVQEIYKRNPGPKFENIVLACPDCDGEVVVPISIGGLFRF